GGPRRGPRRSPRGSPPKPRIDPGRRRRGMSEATATGTPHAELRNVSKRFGGVAALTDVSLPIAAGSIHALVGENGAGKSTLGKILAGAYRPDAGELLVHDRRVEFRSARDALADGITIIAQEPTLVPHRSVV